jgi:chemotaxis protein CheX
MISQEFIIEAVKRSVAQVFATMLGVELGPGEIVESARGAERSGGVVSLIGLAGAWAGSGSVSCSAQMACRICSLMLMTEAHSVDEDVLDAVAEITNMVIGNVKTDLEEHLGPLGLSIPTVIFGRNFQTKTAGTVDWTEVHFDWDGEALVVKFCLAPQESGTSHAAHHLAGHAAIIV